MAKNKIQTKNLFPDPNVIQKLGNLELIARYVVEGFITGLHKSPFHGFSVEFAEHRQYNPGESVRYLDWKLFARTEKMFVKRFEEETNLRTQILIDTSSSMLFPDNAYNKLTFSVYAAASLIYLLRKQRDAVGLTFFSEKIEEHHQPHLNYSHQQLLFNRLEYLLSESKNFNRKKTATTETLHFIAEAIHKRSMVIIFSDMFENTGSIHDLFSGLQHLRYKNHEVVLFHVLDKSKELDFNYKNRPYRFIDLESGEKISLFPEEVRQKYKMAIRKYRDEIKWKSLQYQVDYNEVDIRDGYYEVLQRFLIKRQKWY